MNPQILTPLDAPPLVSPRRTHFKVGDHVRVNMPDFPPEGEVVWVDGPHIYVWFRDAWFASFLPPLADLEIIPADDEE